MIVVLCETKAQNILKTPRKNLPSQTRLADATGPQNFEFHYLKNGCIILTGKRSRKVI